MSRNTLRLIGGRSGSNAPNDGVTMSTTGLETKEGEHENRGSFASTIEGMGDNAT